MSFYRDVYLKSEEWKSLRKETIIKNGFRCRLCGCRPPKKTRPGTGFDVHHLDYKNLYDVKVKDLRTLCRDCHDKVHALMLKYPKLKELPSRVQWLTVNYHLNPHRRSKLAGYIAGIDKKGKSASQHNEGHKVLSIAERFCKIRNVLVERGIIYRRKMIWLNEYESDTLLVESMIYGADRFLQMYIYRTMRDPRRLVPVLFQRLPPKLV